MRKGICIAGNMIVDITYPIEGWPNQGELVHIHDGIARTAGKLVGKDRRGPLEVGTCLQDQDVHVFLPL